jgi:hypothetical protein
MSVANALAVANALGLTGELRLVLAFYGRTEHTYLVAGLIIAHSCSARLVGPHKNLVPQSSTRVVVRGSNIYR